MALVKATPTHFRVSYAFQKWILTFAANHRPMAPILSREEGRFANVTNVGTGCGGRGCLRRESADVEASTYGEIVWS